MPDALRGADTRVLPLSTRGHCGDPADAQLKELEALLLKGAKAHGWRTELWSAARAAESIGQHFHVRFDPEHVRKLLKRRLKWTSQKPQRKAKERDEAAIAH